MKLRCKVRDTDAFITCSQFGVDAESILIGIAIRRLLDKNEEYEPKDLFHKTVTFRKVYWTDIDYEDYVDTYRVTGGMYGYQGHFYTRDYLLDLFKKKNFYDVEVELNDKK